MRLIRFRSTAFFNTRLLIAIPSRAFSSAFGRASRVHLLSEERLDLSRNTASKSRPCSSRTWRGNVNPSLIKTVVNSSCALLARKRHQILYTSQDHTINNRSESSVFNYRLTFAELPLPLRRSLCRKALTSFRSASIDNSAAGFGCHACPKTMGTFTAKITGLKCSFHCTVRLKFVGSQTASETCKKRRRIL